MRIVKETTYKLEMSHEEFMDIYKRWQNKPETKALFAKIAAERKECIARMLAEMDAQKRG